MNFDINKHTIYKCIHGSHAYGTNIPTSDVDIKGICIPPKDILFGILNKFEQYEAMAHNGHENDTTIYSLQKFCMLASECNPNIIEVLWVDDSDILFMDEFGEELRSNKELFLSSKAKFTFAGYCYSQLKRLKTHRAWLLNPPDHEPSRKEFNLPETTKISKGDLGAYDSLIEQNGNIELPHDIVRLFCAEKQYQQAKTYWDQYQNWKATRNKKRAELEAKWGYDTKYGMHCVRLMRMCKEILLEHKVHVKRSDAEELISIRNGAWNYEQLIEFAENIMQECDELYKTTTLQKEPNRNMINQIVVDIIDRYVNKNL